MTFALAAHHETHHHAANIASPPPAFQGAVRPTERVDHFRHRRVRLARMVQHPLRGEVTLDLVPDELEQGLLRNVLPDPKRRRKFDQVQPVGNHQHPVNGPLDTDNVVDKPSARGSEGTGHDYLSSICLLRFPANSPSTPS